MSETIWQTLAVADMGAILADAQLNAIKAGYNSGGVDRFAVISASVVAEVRAAIAKHGKSLSADSGAVPPEAKVKCLWLVLASLQPAIPTLALTPDQKDAIRRAEEWVKDVKENQAVASAVTSPSDAVAASSVAQVGGKATAVFAAPRSFTMVKQEGLV